MVEGEIRVKTLIKFLNLCNLAIDESRFPTLEEITERNNCSKGHAYNYLRALRYLFSEEALRRARRRAERERASGKLTTQQMLV